MRKPASAASGLAAATMWREAVTPALRWMPDAPSGSNGALAAGLAELLAGWVDAPVV